MDHVSLLVGAVLGAMSTVTTTLFLRWLDQRRTKRDYARE